MSKYEVKNSIWYVLAEGIRIYFTNIDKFVMYMLFPVFGQVVGLSLALGLSLGLSDLVISKADSASSAMIFTILLALPGFLIFIKAFWDFMVAYVALNSMAEGAVNTGKVYDFQSHNQVALRRVGKYVLFLAAVGVLSGLASNILLIVPGFILWIYFILVFQIFTFEDELSVVECFKRSFWLVKGNWFRTFLLLAILWFFSIYIITAGVSVVFDYLNLTDKICTIFNFITNTIPLDFCNKVLAYFNQPIITPDMISRSIFYSILSCIVMGLTLPLRSICWSLWYWNLAEVENLCRKQRKRVRAEE